MTSSAATLERDGLACHPMLVVPMLSVVPCAVFVFVLYRVFMTWPTYMNYFDPAYVYLFSGLSFATLQPRYMSTIPAP